MYQVFILQINDYLVYKGFEPSPIIHTKLSTDEVVMEKLQNRDWQYLIESLIYKVEKEKDYYKIKTTEDSEMIQDMSKNLQVIETNTPRPSYYNC